MELYRKKNERTQIELYIQIRHISRVTPRGTEIPCVIQSLIVYCTLNIGIERETIYIYCNPEAIDVHSGDLFYNLAYLIQYLNGKIKFAYLGDIADLA